MPNLSAVRCIAYVRVSTEKQAGEVYTSLEDQRRACDALAAKLGLSVGHIYRDDGYSGATIEQRPAMRELLADCAASGHSSRAPGYVVVLNDSRWGRFPDPEEATYWRVHLAKHGWIVRFAENDDTENKTLRAVQRAIVSGQATQKRDDVKANAKRGMKGSVERGFWCSQAPYGYRRKVAYPPGRERVLESGVRKAIDEKVVLVPDADEARVIRELFERYAGGEHSIQSLIGWLETAAPTQMWKHSTVQRALSNPAYLGDIVFGRRPSDLAERALSPVRDATDWYVHHSAHAPIVDRALFEYVQGLLARNRRTCRGVRSDWVLSGIVTCRCGAPFVSGGGGRRKEHGAGHFEPCYRCSTRNKHRTRQCTYRGTVSKAALESSVIQAIAKEASTPRAMERIAKHLDDVLTERASAPSAHRASLMKERAGIAQRRDRLVAAIEDGTIGRADAKQRLAQLAANEARLTAEIDGLHQRSKNAAQMASDRERILALLADLPRLLMALTGPTLRELVRPWVAGAVFNTETRVLRLEIRHLPRFVMLSDPMGRRAGQKNSAGRACSEGEGVTVRRIVVPRGRVA